MEMLRIIVRSLVVAVCVNLITSSAWAGGAYLYELGTADLGTAGAGRAALAQDASTVAGNPAGMIKLERSELTATLMGIFPSVQFDKDRATTIDGGNGFNAGMSIPSNSSASVPIPGGNLFYVYSPAPNWKLGVAFGSAFGGGLNYGKEWVGRYTVRKTQLMTFTLNPVFAVRLTDWLSVGAGFSVTYGLFSIKSGIDNRLEFLRDGRIKYKADDFGFGGNVGFLLEPSASTRFGITYRSPVEFSYKDRPKFINLGPGLRLVLERRNVIGSKLELEQTAPQIVMASWYHQLTKRAALMGNFGWQNWKQFGDLDIEIRSETTRSITADAGFQDTWHAALGGQYRLTKPLLFSVGFAFDSSAVSKFNRSPSSPYDRNFRYGVGLQYDWNETTAVGLAYEFLDAGSAEIKNRTSRAGILQGHYAPNYIHFIAVNMVKKF